MFLHICTYNETQTNNNIMKLNALLPILFLWSSPCFSLLVSPNSPCEKSCTVEPTCGTPSPSLKQCMNCLQTSTFGSDQTYFRRKYFTLSLGFRFRLFVSCLLSYA